jgi:predicted CXXCH cytochrome family protein
MQLKQDPVALCESCHEPVKKIVTAAAFKHSATTMKDGCLNCHTAHGSDLGKLMKSEPAKACLSCHDKKVDVPKGAAPSRVVASMAAVTDPKQFKHGPIRDGDCSGCHAPHGGDTSRLLAKSYPETFYQPFDIQKYELCFSCHDKQLVLLEKTSGLTKFRNGEQNLHYLHVNKSDKGRSCRACHETHTSAQPLHLRATVPYGKWEMPVSFKQSETGGSCKPGCHEEMGYDRQKPVANRLSTTTTSLTAGKDGAR